MRISSIDQLIEAYKEDLIDNDTLIEILQKQTPHLAVWVDRGGYNYTKAQTLQGLKEYKIYLQAESNYPIFFPEIANTSAGFSFNDAL